jgi:DGQHR domain-containing protein
MDGKFIEIRCIELKQPIGPFYIGSINADDLVEIAYSDIRRLEIEEYLGIQRPLSNKRVDELGNYVNIIDATFPTSIILALSSDDVEYDYTTLTMQIKKGSNIAKIIDGQHRIAGLESFSGKGSDFQANVTIFIDMDIEDQAMVFTTINLKQEKVSKSLAYDLYEYTQSRSPQKTAHNIAKLLNGDETSPFYGKIKILGKAASQGHQTLNQATFVENLLKYISKDPNRDKDILNRKKKLSIISREETYSLLYRNMFVRNDDASIALVLDNYFTAVAERWGFAWNNTKRNYILNKTIGFVALMRFLKTITSELDKPGEVIKKGEFSKILKDIKLKDEDFVTDNYSGTKGITLLYNEFLESRQ